MPTKPLPTLLDRDICKVASKETLAIAGPLLRELVNYSTNVFQRCLDDAVKKDKALTHVPLYSQYHNLITVSDGFEVLLTQSCTVAAMPLLRTAFESMLGISYILETDYEQRAFSWLVCTMNDMKGRYDNRPEHHREEYARDLSDEDINEATSFHLPDEIRNGLETLLTSEIFIRYHNEYIRLRDRLHRPPTWFGLFNGPGTIRQLAKRFNREHMYDNLYRRWSAVTHAANSHSYVYDNLSKKPKFIPIRTNNDMVRFSAIAASFLSISTLKIIQYFRPGEAKSVGRWYTQEIQKPLWALVYSYRRNDRMEKT